MRLIYMGHPINVQVACYGASFNANATYGGVVRRPGWQRRWRRGGGGDDCRPRQSKKTNLVFQTTKSVANDKICLPDNKVCRGRQSMSLATMLVVSDEPKLYVHELMGNIRFQNKMHFFTYTLLSVKKHHLEAVAAKRANRLGSYLKGSTKS